MVPSEMIIQAGGSILFASHGIAGLAVLNIIIHTVYCIRVAEPNLEKTFGRDYIDYKKYAARWIPKFHPWKPVIILSCKEIGRSK
jgi:protein-S-isoprenylcysteine O-methyltransferase Ste14